MPEPDNLPTKVDTQDKLPIGRPPFYTDPKDMQIKVDEYFKECELGRQRERLNKKGEVVTYTQPIPYTVPGLAYHLGFATRQSLIDYGRKNDEYLDTIKRAKIRIEMQRIEKGLSGENNPIISIFDLKNNFGYIDKQEVKLDHGLRILDYRPRLSDESGSEGED